MRWIITPAAAVLLLISAGAWRGEAQVSTPSAPVSQPSWNAPLAVQFARMVLDALEVRRERPSADAALLDRVDAFYAARNFQPAWLWNDDRAAAGVLIDRMRSAPDDGLPGWQERADRWTNWQVRERDLQQAIDRDVGFSVDVITFAVQLAYGADSRSQRELDVVQLLADARNHGAAREVVARLEPQHREYRALRRALREYRRIAASEGWREVPEDVLLKLEDGAVFHPTSEGTVPGTAVRAVCHRLIASGDLPSESDCGFGPNAPPAYGPSLAAAVRRFQTRHGLVPDGIVGPKTARTMNVSADERIAQLVVNMDRWRALPDDLGHRHVLVNAPGFWLKARRTAHSDVEMGVVVGEPETPTPVMTDAITYLEFRPYWNVPRSITESELLPQIARDPSYLRRNHFEVVDGWSEPATVVDPSSIDWQAARHDFPYRLRQRPGPWNSLGLVKFMFPNEHNVYLHDTPATHRFEERRRAFSHGCVRVEDPVTLAEFLLQDDPQWTREAIVGAMNGAGREVVPLPTAVPVHLTYFTAWVEEETVHFRGDLYGRDAAAVRNFRRETDADVLTETSSTGELDDSDSKPVAD